MFRRVRFQCLACGEGFVDWHDEEWERTPVFCVGCGEPIAAGEPVDAEEGSAPAAESEAPVALGVVKGSGAGFPDTLPGLRVARLVGATSDAPESGPDPEREPEPAQRSAKAGSSAPLADVPSSRSATGKRQLARLGALCMGFALGVPLTLLAEKPISELVYPGARARAELSSRLSQVSVAIDDGDLRLARSLLDTFGHAAPARDGRIAALRARIALGLVLANRPEDAERELAAGAQLPGTHPSAADVRRVSEALFVVAKPSALPASSSVVASASASPASTSASAPPVTPKPTVTKQELIAFARDRQRRSQLDDAQRLYEAVLRFHPDDSEARCGLAEIQLLRGSVSDAQALFERALRGNANYIPAWVGLADIDWLRGRPERAACRYQAVVDRSPHGGYPPYITQRIARVRSSGVGPPAARSDVPAAAACD